MLEEASDLHGDIFRCRGWCHAVDLVRVQPFQ